MYIWDIEMRTHCLLENSYLDLSLDQAIYLSVVEEHLNETELVLGRLKVLEPPVLIDS